LLLEAPTIGSPARVTDAATAVLGMAGEAAASRFGAVQADEATATAARAVACATSPLCATGPPSELEQPAHRIAEPRIESQ
jgi:hypothetical protein